MQSRKDKRPRPLDDDMLSLNSVDLNHLDPANLEPRGKMGVNSQMSSVVQLEDDSNAESISFQIPPRRSNPELFPSDLKPNQSSSKKNLKANSSGLSLQISRQDESILTLQKKVASLRAMEVQNMELKAQVMQTKRILIRLEEQMAG